MKKRMPVNILSDSTGREEVSRKFLNSDVEWGTIKQMEVLSGEVASFGTYEIYLEYTIQEHILVPRPM